MTKQELIERIRVERIHHKQDLHILRGRMHNFAKVYGDRLYDAVHCLTLPVPKNHIALDATLEVHAAICKLGSL